MADAPVTAYMVGNPVARPVARSHAETGDLCATRRAFGPPTPGSADERMVSGWLTGSSTLKLYLIFGAVATHLLRSF